MEKKKVAAIIIICLLVTIIASVIAYGAGVFAGGPNISEDEAKAIAEEETGGKAISIDLEREGSLMLYEVGVETEDGVAEVEIDAQTGEVIEVEYGDDDDSGDDDD